MVNFEIEKNTFPMALTVFAEWTKQDADRLRDLYVLLRLYCLWEP